MTLRTKYLFVTCCLEESRAEVVRDVIDNLVENKELLGDNLTVFDNGSTVDWVVPELQKHFECVCVSDQNVGYWSAIHWWLNNVKQSDFTYIIESDMIHYALEKIRTAEQFLAQNPDVGAVRLHQYEVANKHLYDKNRPRPDSKRNIWQSHVNRVNNKKVFHTLALKDGDVEIYTNNFLTQLPALNRTKMMIDAFNELATRKSFSEFDFQKLCWERYQRNAIIDGGIFHCDGGSYGRKVVTGSWTDPQELQRIGYRNTRVSEIVDPTSYVVTCTRPCGD